MTSLLLPHPPYAEDQPYAKSILTIHVLSRFWQTGATVALATSAVRTLIARGTGKPLTRTLLLDTTGRGALAGAVLGVPAVFGRMRGREDVEWQDRAWRLLENPGQREVDGWSSAGFVVGAVTAAARGPALGSAGRLSLLRLAGGAAMGDLVGVVGYLGWRYGVRGGRRE